MSDFTEYEELISFLSHKNKTVQSQALDIVVQSSGDLDPKFVSFINKDAESVVRPLLRFIETSERDYIENSLSALVNLATIDSVVEAVCKLSGVRRVCDSLNQRQIFIELHCMLLTNLTRMECGVTQLLDIAGIFKSVVLKYAAVDTEDVDSLGAVVINATSVVGGRKIISELQTDSQGYTHCLLIQCLARGLTIRRRRVALLKILRNLALDLDSGCHEGIASSGILINMCYFLYPEVDNRREDDVHKLITEHGIGLASDVETRTLAAEIFVCMLRSDVGRDVMRTIGVYEVVRLWDLQETETSVKDMLYDVAMATHMTEDELKTGTLEEPPNRVVEL